MSRKSVSRNKRESVFFSVL